MTGIDVAFFDSHCHLDPVAFEDDAGVDAAVERALEAGVLRMLTIGSGYGYDTAHRAVAVAGRHERVWATVGLHPHDAEHYTEARFADLLALTEHPRVVALGEMGLDFYYDNSPRDQQRAALRAQLRAARAHQLPVIVHDRDSGGETLQILQEEGAFEPAEPGRGGVVYHCFTGTADEMEAIVALGGYSSLPGIITFKNAQAMREVARRVPLDRLFIETDSPFLTPVPFRGRRNEPARVTLVGEAVARERGVPVAEVARRTWDSASRFFGIEG